MSSLFSGLVSGIASEITSGLCSYLQRSASGPDQNKVAEVTAEKFASWPVHCREDGMVLYGPSPPPSCASTSPFGGGRRGSGATGQEKVQPTFEILLHKPYTDSLSQAYSLFRTADVEEAEVRFLTMRDKLPTLLDMSRELYNVAGLQKTCDLLRLHPTWTVAHLAASLDLLDSLKSNVITGHVNRSAEEDGLTPLHLATKNQNLRMVQGLLASGATLSGADHSGDTVFHYAACTNNKHLIQALAESENMATEEAKVALNSRNLAGLTPLHMACKEDKPESVRALLCAGADANAASGEGDISSPGEACAKDIMTAFPGHLHSKDMKLGGTPLHWAKGKQVIEALLEVGCNAEVTNFEGDTALHVMVERDRFPCVVTLLCHGALVDAVNKDGNTALHFAVRKSNIHMVQALLCFGANPNAVNHAGHNVRHLAATSGQGQIPGNMLHILHSVGAKRCPRNDAACADGCRNGQSYDGIPPDSVPATRSRRVLDEMLAMTAMSGSGKGPGAKLLCLDGGGIRGLVLTQMLVDLEKMLGRPVGKAFDWISGTSTGGILALALAQGKSARHCQQLYFKLKDKIFVGSRPYASEALEQMLRVEFGEEANMTSIKTPKVMVTGVLADRYPADLHLFRNYRSPESILGLDSVGGSGEGGASYQPTPSPEQQLIWRAARSSGAAPTYFRASGRFIDGGLIANNPTLDSMTEVHEYFAALRATGQCQEPCRIAVVVSLGTGKVPVTPVNAIDIFRPESLVDTARLAFGMSALGKLLVDQAACSDGRVVDRARAWCSSAGTPYFRLTPQLTEDVQLDETRDEVIVNMMWETQAYVQSKRKDFERLLEILNA